MKVLVVLGSISSQPMVSGVIHVCSDIFIICIQYIYTVYI